MYLRKPLGVEVDPSKCNDGMVCFGQINGPLQTLDATIRFFFGPLIREQQRNEWGKTTHESKQEFLVGVDILSHNLQESLKTLSSGLQLNQPNPAVERMGEAVVVQDRGMVAELVELLDDWCVKVEAYLTDDDRSRWETSTSGPDTELEFWRRRMQRLTSITEQLKTPQSKFVVGCLSVVARQPPDSLMDRDRIVTLQRRWKKVDLDITEALNEAKDNMKYLSALERFMPPLYSGDPMQIIDCLPSLMNALKMIHTISRYFNTVQRMTRLFMKVTNQMITTFKLAINGAEPSERLWKREPEKLLGTLELCLRLNESYQEQYRQAKEKLTTMPKGK